MLQSYKLQTHQNLFVRSTTTRRLRYDLLHVIFSLSQQILV
jgi:hypothetical protein